MKFKLNLFKPRHPLILDELENAINLPTQEEIKAFAIKKRIPLIMPNRSKPGVIHDHESQTFQKHPDTKVENEELREKLSRLINDPSLQKMDTTIEKTLANWECYQYEKQLTKSVSTYSPQLQSSINGTDIEGDNADPDVVRSHSPQD